MKEMSQLQRKIRRDCKVVYVRNPDVPQKTLS